MMGVTGDSETIINPKVDDAARDLVCRGQGVCCRRLDAGSIFVFESTDDPPLA